MSVLENTFKSLDLGGERRLTRLQKLWRRLRRNKGALFGLAMVSAVLISGVFAPLLSPHDPILQDVEKRLLPPLGQSGSDAITAALKTAMLATGKPGVIAFQGAFHANPDYANWYGWSEMARDLVEIRAEAATLRREHAADAAAAKKK